MSQRNDNKRVVIVKNYLFEDKEGCLFPIAMTILMAILCKACGAW